MSDVLRAIEPQDWMVKVHLKDAYFHVPIVHHHCHFLHFHFEGKTFQFKVLPFGLSLAPRVFANVVQAALAPLQQKGICVLPYLDDLLLCTNPTKVAENLNHLLAHIAKLGFSIHQTKCQLIPGQCIQFLGVQQNSRNMTASLTKVRAQKILSILAKIKPDRSVRYLTLLRLAGMLAAVTPVVRLCMLYLRPFQRWLIGRRLSAKTQKYSLVRVMNTVCQSLRSWRSTEFLMQGVPMGPPPAGREIVTTDASQQGWGGVWNQRGVKGIWEKTLPFQHINYLELKAVFSDGLSSFLEQIDSQTDTVRQQGGCIYMHKSSGRHGVTKTLSGCAQTLGMGRHPPVFSESSTHTGVHEQGSRCVVTECTSVRGVATPSRDSAINLEHVWGSKPRSVCKQSVNAMSEMVLAKQGSGMARTGCDGPQLAEWSSVRIPSVPDDLVSSQSHSGNESAVVINSPMLAEQTVVLAPSPSFDGPAGPVADQARSLDTVEWQVTARSTSDSEIVLLAVGGNTKLLVCSQWVWDTVLNARAV
ncbi:hypothetical protein M9458_051641 [Cirrhinus mrigala]|uniref:ribonuclease H n=1 Tax=Cirrhinus mrigala TaxID=683832 RepID=A0ABD0MW50_CIRMR